MSDQSAIRMSISLSDREKTIVNEESQKRGLRNFSAALRVIINEWKELTAPTPPDNGKPGEE